MQTVLQIVQDVCARRGLPVPTSVVNSRDSQIVQMAGLLQTVLNELVRDYQWEALTYEATFTTVLGEDQGAMTTLAPNGFVKVITSTFFNRTRRIPFYGPLDERQWQQLKTLPNPGPYYRFRIRGGRMLFTPPGVAGENCAFEYSSDWVLASNSTLVTKYARLAADTDVVLLDGTMVGLGLETYWLKAKGQDWSTEWKLWQNALDEAKGRDASKAVLSLDGPSNTIQPGVFVPAGSWF